VQIRFVLQEAGVLPRSTLFGWSCGHFSRPLLEPSYEEEEEGMQRRAARERMALEGISTCQHLSEEPGPSAQPRAIQVLNRCVANSVLMHPVQCPHNMVCRDMRWV
jgi:regulator-associated protein of mTOR